MYGILGESLPHTLSPFLHRELWNCQYRKLEMSRDKAEEFIRLRQFDGINVTIPYKKTAFDCCDVLSDTAKRVGCVNTVIIRTAFFTDITRIITDSILSAAVSVLISTEKRSSFSARVGLISPQKPSVRITEREKPFAFQEAAKTAIRISRSIMMPIS